MSRPAIDSIQSGLLNARANWQLVIVSFLQTLAVTVISALGFLPIVLVLGFTVLKSALAAPERGGAELLGRLLGGGIPILAAAAAALLIWTLAFIVYCYFQGGSLGILAAGQRRATEGGSGWRSYGAFTRRSFLQLAESLTWPVFWILNLFFAIGLVVLLVFAFGGAGIALLAGRAEIAAIGLGCVLLLLLLVSMVFFSIWLKLALAELACHRRGVLAAAGSALAIFGRRLPGLALLVLLLFVASLVVGLVVMPLSLVLEIGFRESFSAYLAGQAFVTLLQWMAGAALQVVWSGTVIALVSGEVETRSDSGPEPAIRAPVSA